MSSLRSVSSTFSPDAVLVSFDRIRTRWFELFSSLRILSIFLFRLLEFVSASSSFRWHSSSSILYCFSDSRVSESEDSSSRSFCSRSLFSARNDFICSLKDFISTSFSATNVFLRSFSAVSRPRASASRRISSTRFVTDRSFPTLSL